MSDLEKPAFWDDQAFAKYLPGGEGYEVDAALGHPALAVRLRAEAMGPLVPLSFCEDGESCRQLVLGKGGWFTGALEVFAGSGGMTFRLLDVGARSAYPLSIEHEQVFERLLVELTDDIFALSEFGAQASAWELLRPVLEGGDRWAEDRAAGHVALAVRIHRLLTASRDSGAVRRIDETGYESTWLPIANRCGLALRRWKRSDPAERDVVENFDGPTLWLCRFGPGEKKVEKVKISNSDAFWGRLRGLDQG